MAVARGLGSPFFLFAAREEGLSGREWNPKKWGELITSVILRKKSTTTLEWCQDFIARVRERERERETISDVVTTRPRPPAPLQLGTTAGRGEGARQVLKRAFISSPCCRK